MHGVRRSSVDGRIDHRSNSSSRRKSSILEVAETHLDKNTIILIVNVFILMILMGILYMVATSAMYAGGSIPPVGKDEN